AVPSRLLVVALPSSLLLLGDRLPATTHTSTLSLHDALPILSVLTSGGNTSYGRAGGGTTFAPSPPTWSSARPGARVGPLGHGRRSEEHTSELQSRGNLVCRLLLEKKKCKRNTITNRRRAPTT